MLRFSIIAAADKKMGIGIKNGLPWRLKGDMKYFSDTTTKTSTGKINAVIMGLNTWLSLPEKHRPLPLRINVVLSFEKPDLPENVYWAESFEDAFEKLSAVKGLDQVFVIGGASIYRQAIERPECERVYLTEVEGEFNCDVFFPQIPLDRFKKNEESEVNEESGIKYRFSVFSKK
jgi:dihydrofolate reductase